MTNAPLHLFYNLDATGRTDVTRQVRRRLAALEFAPKARASDPQTSHEAAATVLPSMVDLDAAIRTAVNVWWDITQKPPTAFNIAERVRFASEKRWKDSTIRTRVSALEKHRDGFLEVADELGREGRCSVRRYRMRGA